MAFPNLSSLVTMIFSFAALRDWLKLVLIGGILEAVRRSALSTYQKIVDSLWITALFQDDDVSYNWIMVWLSKQPNWSKAREVEISTRAFGRNDAAVLVPGEKENTSSAISGSRQLAYLPSASSTYSMWYKGRLMLVTRVQTTGGLYGKMKETLHLSILAHNHNLLNQILLEAKTQYKADNANTISIYVSDCDNDWRHLASRPKRPLRSVVLDPGIKDLLINDAREFLESKSWYTERGIPFRRGYLLYGAPGSGKTSIIHSMAGELGLDIYSISLSRAGLDDTSLNELISNLPEKCIALMEDIDVAFYQGLTRNDDSDLPEAIEGGPKPQAYTASSRISLSGLLNALDGIGAQEGRLLFATTNKFSTLDPALCRPGRMDLHIEFKLASKFQAQALFRSFYLPSDDVDNKEGETDGGDSGYSSSTILDHNMDNPGLEDKTDEKDESFNELIPTVTGKPHRSRLPQLSRSQISHLARRFVRPLPEREFSMASLQGYLMTYKTRPFEAVRKFGAWIEKERAERIEKEKSSILPMTSVGSPSPRSLDSGDC